MSKVFEYDLMILEKHLDAFGHVNNAIYLELYEEARWDFLTKNSYGLDKILKERLAPVIIDLKVSYKKEIKNRTKIKILTNFVDMKNPLVMILEQKMINEDEQVVSTKELTMGIMDLDKRRLVRPNDEWKRALGIIS